MTILTVSAQRSSLHSAETLTVCSAQAELENDGRAIIQHDGVDVGGTSREILRGNVENPLRAVPTERGVRIVGVHDVLYVGRRRSGNDLCEEKAGDNSGRSNGDAIGVTNLELRRDGSALVTDRGAGGIDRRENHVTADSSRREHHLQPNSGLQLCQNGPRPLGP